MLRCRFVADCSWQCVPRAIVIGKIRCVLVFVSPKIKSTFQLSGVPRCEGNPTRPLARHDGTQDLVDTNEERNHFCLFLSGWFDGYASYLSINSSVGLAKGAKVFNGHSGMWHLHYAHLAHCHMP